MKKTTESIIIILSVVMLCACAENTEKDADIAVSSEIALDQEAESDSEVEAIKDMEVTNATEAADQEDEEMRSGLDDYTNIEVTGIDTNSLTEEQMEILLLQAKYCQAMTDADTDTMRELVSEDMTYTHMSGKTQTREEYFADIEKGRLNYYTIGIENPVIEVDGDTATIEYTSVLNANAYGARGTFRMSGIHHYEKRDGSWILVNR
jgi:hypothetical protein